MFGSFLVRQINFLVNGHRGIPTLHHADNAVEAFQEFITNYCLPEHIIEFIQQVMSTLHDACLTRFKKVTIEKLSSKRHVNKEVFGLSRVQLNTITLFLIKLYMNLIHTSNYKYYIIQKCH